MAVILLVSSGWLAGQSLGQVRSQASHRVTVERVAETRVVGPSRVPIGSENLVDASARLEVSSNVPLLKIVFTVVEPSHRNASISEKGEAAPTPELRQIFSTQELVHSDAVHHVDLVRIVQEIPPGPHLDGDPVRRLVVTVTE